VAAGVRRRCRALAAAITGRIHAFTLEALRLHSVAADQIITGVDTGDVDLLSQAAGNIEQGGVLVDQASDLFNEFRRERGV
jgi:hypothetical protein